MRPDICHRSWSTPLFRLLPHFDSNYANAENSSWSCWSSGPCPDIPWIHNRFATQARRRQTEGGKLLLLQSYSSAFHSSSNSLYSLFHWRHYRDHKWYAVCLHRFYSESMAYSIHRWHWIRDRILARLTTTATWLNGGDDFLNHNHNIELNEWMSEMYLFH